MVEHGQIDNDKQLFGEIKAMKQVMIKLIETLGKYGLDKLERALLAGL